MKKLFVPATIFLFFLVSCGGVANKEDVKVTVVSTEVAESPEGMRRVTIKNVQGLCEMCQDNIQKAAMIVTNVESVTWSADTKDLVLTSTDQVIDVEAVSKAIAEAGYDVGETYKADDKVYAALPGCCQYRK